MNVSPQNYLQNINYTYLSDKPRLFIINGKNGDHLGFVSGIYYRSSYLSTSNHLEMRNYT